MFSTPHPQQTRARCSLNDSLQPWRARTGEGSGSVRRICNSHRLNRSSDTSLSHMRGIHTEEGPRCDWCYLCVCVCVGLCECVWRMSGCKWGGCSRVNPNQRKGKINERERKWEGMREFTARATFTPAATEPVPHSATQARARIRTPDDNLVTQRQHSIARYLCIHSITAPLITCKLIPRCPRVTSITLTKKTEKLIRHVAQLPLLGSLKKRNTLLWIRSAAPSAVRPQKSSLSLSCHL